MRIIDPAEVARRRQALLERDRERKTPRLSANERRSLTQQENRKRRKRELLDRQRRDYHTAMGHMPATKVLTDWHQDEQGCRARSVGAEP